MKRYRHNGSNERSSNDRDELEGKNAMSESNKCKALM